MSTKKNEYPFEVDERKLAESVESFVDSTFASLSSHYLELPRGENFLEYEDFKKAYDVLRDASGGFTALDQKVIFKCIAKDPRVFAVLRCIVGVSPPDLADMASELGDVKVTQGSARTLDQKARKGEKILADKGDSVTNVRIAAIVEAACKAIEQFPMSQPKELFIHRLDKIDTKKGLNSLAEVAAKGVEYPALLYERMLGRPFASHRDAVSELVGDIVEAAVMKVLSEANVPFYKTRRAEAIDGFDQAPDFLIPDKTKPKVVIEAKLTQDDGTARDKVTRLQHLRQLSDNGDKFEVVACIDGRGFRIRREDMKKLLRATKGKVFTLATMDQLVKQTSLKQFAS